MKRSKRYLRKSSIYFVLILLIGIVVKFTMSYFSQAVRTYTESMIISYARQTIDQGITEGVVDLLDGKSLIKESVDANGKVSYAYVDAKTINYLRNNISIYITKCIEEINKGETFQSIELPLGYFFGRNYFLTNGIKVPIHLEVVGHQSVELEKIVESYGLNTTLLQINLNITIHIKSVIPFQTEVVKTKSSIPIALELLNNDIPYYLGDIFK